MLMGEYHHNIDEKGRLIRGLDGCLFIYGMKEWNNIISKLKTLPFTKQDARTFNRFFLSGATVCIFDKQGRINLPSSLINYANIQKECTIIGVNDRLEVWASDRFDNLISNNMDKISEVAENLFEGFDIDA